jgi:hypothetical protein
VRVTHTRPIFLRQFSNIRSSVLLIFSFITLIGEATEADKLFLRIQKEFGSISRMKAVEAQIEYLKFLNKQGNLKAASLLGQ